MQSAYRVVVGKDAHKFSAAHMTVFPDGSKESLHGHNFQVQVAVDLKDIEFPNFLDFSVIKKAVGEQCREWDEKLLLAEKCPFFELIRRDTEVEFKLCGKRYIVPTDEVAFLPLENIMTETLAFLFAQGILKRMDLKNLTRSVLGIEVRITETNGQSGQFYWSAQLGQTP